MTGASRGLGAAMAVGLAASRRRRGACTATQQPATDTADAIARPAGRRTDLFTADLADRARRRRWSPTRSPRSGGSTSWSTTPASSAARAAAEHSDDDWDAVIEVNLSNAFRLCRAMGKHLIDAQTAGQDHQRRVAAVVPGRHHRARLRRRQGRHRAAHQGAGQRVGRRTASTSTPSRPATCRPTTPRRCEKIRSATSRSPSAFPRAAGARRRTSAAPRSSWRRRPPTYVHGHVLVVDGGWMGR